MKDLPDLKHLTDEAKDALIVTLWEELQKLRQKKPKKTSKNSSLPPAKGFKTEVKGEEKETQGKREASLGRAGGGRPLSETPDQTIKATVKSCQNCGIELGESLQTLLQRYDKIDIPAIQPVVTRVEQYGCSCPGCGQQQISTVPVGMEAGSPFGNRIAALITTLRYSHAISYSRMKQLLGEVFGLEISEGGIANLLERVKGELETEVDGILEALQSSRLVCSDETSARVKGKNQWEWVFQNESVCFHIIRPSRGGDVIEAVMAGHQPQIWVSHDLEGYLDVPGLG
jgi:transposase